MKSLCVCLALSELIQQSLYNFQVNGQEKLRNCSETVWTLKKCSLSRESAFRATWEFVAALPLVLRKCWQPGVLTFDYGWPWSEGSEICVGRLLVPKIVDQEGEETAWGWKKSCLQGGKHISRILTEVMGNSTVDLSPRSTKETSSISSNPWQIFNILKGMFRLTGNLHI